MKQYIKSKPIKWGFKMWCRCDSRTGYLYEFDLYLGKKEAREDGLGETVVLQLAKKLEDTNCWLYFDNFFNSPTLIHKLYDRGIYAVGTQRSNRKFVPDMKPDKEMTKNPRGDIDIRYSKKAICCKWYDNKPVLMMGSNVEGIDDISTIPRRMKGASSKTPVQCPEMIKLYNKNMGGVDLMDQRVAAHRLDRRSKTRYYLRIFFDLMDICVSNSFVVFDMIRPNKLDFLNWKILIAKRLIGFYCSRKRNPKRQRSSGSLEGLAARQCKSHLPVIAETRARCKFCQTENRTNIRCNECGVHLCMVAGKSSRNCFYDYHQ